MARNTVTIRTNDSRRRLEVTYEHNATYRLTARQKRYYVVAKWVAEHQQITGEPIKKEHITASVAWYNKQRAKPHCTDRQARDISICTSFSAFYQWWMKRFLVPAKKNKGCWIVTDDNGDVEDPRAREVLSDVFQSQVSQADGNTYWLGDIARVKIVVEEEGGGEIRGGVIESFGAPAHGREYPAQKPKTIRIPCEQFDAQAASDLLEYLQMMEAELSRSPLLDQFGRRLDDLRIPLRVVPYEPVRDLAEIRAREHFRRTGSLGGGSNREDEAPRRGWRVGASRGTVQEDTERSGPHPEGLAELEPKLQTAILLGDPGSGKTEWLKHQALQAARKALDGLVAGALRPADIVFPAFVQLDEVSISLQDENSLRDFLFQTGCCPYRPSVLNDEQQLAAAILAALVKHHHLSARLAAWVWHKLTDGRLSSVATGQSASGQGSPPLLCLDAWDKVPSGHDRLAQCLNAYAKKTSARLFVTSRLIGYSRHLLPLDTEPRDARRELRICPFEQTETETFVTAFFRDDPQCAQKMIEEMRGKVAVRDMARNPLLVTLLCVAFLPSSERHPLTLPARRVEIYKRVLMEFLGTWKKVDKKEWLSPGLIEAKLRLLEEMAFRFFPQEKLSEEDMHDFLLDEEHGYMTKVPEGHPFRQLSRSNSDRGLIKELCDDGVLVPCGGADGFRFLHFTFQEYLTACHLARLVNAAGWDKATATAQGPDKVVAVKLLIDKKAWLPDWQEAISLLAGRLTDPGPLLELLADRKKDDLFCHHLALAALCLGEVDETWLSRHDMLVNRITQDAFSIWWQHQLRGTQDVIQHFEHALPVLGMVNGKVNGTHFLEYIEQRLHDSDRTVLKSTASVVKHVGSAAATPAILRRLADMLASKEEEECSAALDAISGLGAAAATSDFLPGLTDLLSCPHGRAWVRGVQAVQLLGRSCGTPPILSALANLLHRQGEDLWNDTYIHARTAEAVAVLGEAAATPEIFTGMAKVLVERDDYCGHVAAEWLEAVHRGGLVETIRARLAEMLRDRDDHVRSAAAEATGTICAVTPMPEIQLYLQESFADSPRHAAAQTITGLANSLATSAILDSLVSMLGSTNENLTQSARQTIRRISLVPAASDVQAHIAVVNQEATESESLCRLAERLHQRDTSHQLFALRELERIGPTAATSEVLDGLYQALASDDDDLVVAGLRVAESLGRAAATPGVFARVWALRNSGCVRIHWAARYATTAILHELDVSSVLDQALRHLRLPDASYTATVCIWALGDLVPMRDFSPHLSQLLCHQDETVRKAATRILKDSHGEAATPEVLASLDRLIRSTDTKLQHTAVVGIGYLERAWPTTVVRLIELICHAENPLRERAIWALRGLRSHFATPEVSRAVSAVLAREAAEVRNLRRTAFLHLGREAEKREFFDRLLDALTHESNAARKDAAIALGGVDPAAARREVLSALPNLLHDADREVREAAIATTTRIGREAATDEIMIALIDLLADMPLQVGEALLEMCDASLNTLILARLTSLLSNDSAEVRRSAALVILKIGLQTGSLAMLSDVLFLFEEDDGGVEQKAIRILGEMEIEGMSTSPDILAFIVNLTRTPNRDVWIGALQAIARIVAPVATPEMLTRLGQMVRDDDARVRDEAIRTIRSMGLAAATKPIVTGLLEAMARREAEHPAVAARMLRLLMAQGIRVFRTQRGRHTVLTVAKLARIGPTSRDHRKGRDVEQA